MTDSADPDWKVGMVPGGLPEGFALMSREVPEYALTEYRIVFRAETIQTIPVGAEDLRDALLEYALQSLVHFIEGRMKEVRS